MFITKKLPKEIKTELETKMDSLFNFLIRLSTIDYSEDIKQVLRISAFDSFHDIKYKYQLNNKQNNPDFILKYLNNLIENNIENKIIITVNYYSSRNKNLLIKNYNKDNIISKLNMFIHWLIFDIFNNLKVNKEKFIEKLKECNF